MYIFLSCSFQREDADVNDFVTSILTGLGLTFKNVSTASHRTPPDEARKLIDGASAVVAVATRRDRIEGGGYKMADSVRDEISIAYALRRPLLLLVEEGIVLAGFVPNYGTYLEFERQSLARPVFVQRLIDAARNVALGDSAAMLSDRHVSSSRHDQSRPHGAITPATVLRENGFTQEAVERFLSSQVNLSGDLLRRLLRDVGRAIATNENELVIDHALTILSYDLFWKLLLERLARNEAITVRAVHSSTMDVWSFNPDLIARQRQFCEKGGRIVRVLCSRGSVPPADVLAAANMMMPHAEVLYYDIASLRVLDHTFTWDFAITNHGDAAIWESIGPAGVIVKAVFTSSGEYKGYNLQVLWDEIAAAAVPVRAEDRDKATGGGLTLV